MLHTTPETIADLKQILQDRGIESNNLRIIAQIGWGGISFDLVLDEPTGNDKVEEYDGINFIADEKVIGSYAPFNMNSIKRGNQTYLYIDSVNNSGGGGGCDSCSSCG